MNHKNRKRSLAVCLRQWLGSRSIVRGLRALSSQTGIKEETLLTYFKGKAFPKEENLDKLLLVPGLEFISTLSKEKPSPSKKAPPKKEKKAASPRSLR